MAAVRCPSGLDPWMRKAGAVGAGLEALAVPAATDGAADPLFRRAGIDLDEGGERASTEMC